jgi:hypothetical protein
MITQKRNTFGDEERDEFKVTAEHVAFGFLPKIHTELLDS